jgi:NADPH-dependent ferric siderophore reductase
MTGLTAAPTVQAWRFFDARVAAVTRLSPSFVRLTLRGPDLDAFADNGWDQRFKLVLPDAHGSYDALPRDPEWYDTWRRLPADLQNPIRTYTVRAVRAAVREVDVDLVLHGDVGPASRFAGRARVGDPVVLLGPNAAYGDVHGGLEFRPPDGHAGPTVLVGDATAAPAVLSILVLEVPDARDVVDVALPVGFRVTWLVQQAEGSGLGAALDEALVGLGAALDEALVRLGLPVGSGAEAPPPDPGEDEPLWDVPEQAAADGLYAWIAGESGLVTGLRRHLVRDLGVERRSVAFMGYWRRGRPGG